MSGCPLCKALADDPFLYEDSKVRILSTLHLKGHREGYRLMVVSKEHVAHVSRWLEEYMMDKLEEIGRLVFVNEPKLIIMSPVLGSVPDHAHFVATDLDPDAADFSQILKTPWLRVVDLPN